MRGCRAPELTNGQLQKTLRELSTTNASRLLASLQRDLSAESRALLLQEFELGELQLTFPLNMRLGHWRHPPWCVFGCAHHDPAVSKRFLNRCLNMQPNTQLVAELQQPELLAQIQRYLDEDETLSNLPDLAKFLGKLYFCPVAERAVEGDHAQAAILGIRAVAVLSW